MNVKKALDFAEEAIVLILMDHSLVSVHLDMN